MRDVYEVGDMVQWRASEGDGCGVIRRVEPTATPRSSRRYRIEHMDARAVLKSFFEVTTA